MSASESLMPGPQGKTPRYYDVDRGTKTESYISAISGNPLPPPKATPLPQKAYSQVPSAEIEQFQVDTRRDQIGLTEKELAKYRSDVKWRVIRIVLFLLLILLWLAMFLGVVYVVWTSPGCQAQEKPHWWQSAVAYNIWIPSFQDSDSDGVGDVTGIINRLENLRKSGIQTVWPNPFLLSDNMGSAVRNFAQMDSRFGVNQLADDMIQKIHDKDMRVVISIPIATTSLEHEWFLASASASKPESKNYSEFYHWSNKEADGEYYSKHKNLVYLHEQNDSRAAVLNWQSSQVRSHMFSVLSDWIDRGVDGFYLQGIEYLARTAKGDKADWSAVQDVLRDIRDHVDTYAKESLALKEKKKIALFASRDDANEKDKRVLAATGIDSIINYELGKVVKDTDICHKMEGTVANCVHEILSDVLLFHKNNEKVLPQWEFGNPYVSRVATRVGSRAHAELLSMLQLLLPGVNNVYYGDELGMRDLANDTKVPVQRGAMQWTGDKHAGFSEVTPEVPVHPDYKNINWERQYTSGSSHLKMFSKLAKLRQRDDVIKTGKTFIGRLVDGGFVLTRFSQKDNVTTGNIYVAAVNFAPGSVSLPLQDLPSNYKLSKVQIIAVTSNVDQFRAREMTDFSDKTIVLKAEQGVVFRYQA